jgi:adenosylhomocysteine nucleosidase
MPMSKTAIVAALEREVRGLTHPCLRVERTYEGRKYVFFEKDELEKDDVVVVCGGIGAEAARRAAEAVIALYHPTLLHSVGFAGALNPALHVGDIITPAVVINTRDGSRVQIEGGEGTLVTFMAVATAAQKANLAQAYAAQAVDMEASAVAAAAHAHNLQFTATKVISDGLHFEMSQTARFIDVHGRFKTAAFALHVALRPWLWGRVAKLATNSSKAARILGEHLKQSCNSFSDKVAHQKLKQIAETKTH